jgi:hypothetical protein
VRVPNPGPKLDRRDRQRMAEPGLLRLALQRRTVLTALKVALFVGAILNIVNNGERIAAGEAINWWQFALNFLVPYCVSSYSAARNEAVARRRRSN